MVEPAIRPLTRTAAPRPHEHEEAAYRRSPPSPSCPPDKLSRTVTAQVLDNLARAISRTVGGLWLRNIPAMERALAGSAAAGLPVDTLLERAAHHACLGHRGKAANWIAVACLLHREEAWR